MPGDEAAEQRLARLRQGFRERLRRDIQILRECVETLRTAPAFSDALTRMRLVAHGLAGSCGTFGYPVAGEKAAALEKACNEMLAKQQSGVNGTSYSKLSECVDEIANCTKI